MHSVGGNTKENSDLHLIEHSTTTDKENDYLDKLYSKQTSYSQNFDESSSQNPKKKLWTSLEVSYCIINWELGQQACQSCGQVRGSALEQGQQVHAWQVRNIVL
jgi:hypothetical protein